MGTETAPGPLPTPAAQTYSERWALLQAQNPGAFSAKFTIPVRILIVIFVVFLIKYCESSLPIISSNECLVDYMHDHTSSMNTYLASHMGLAKVLQSCYTFFIDASVVLFLLFWISKGRSMRPIIALAL